MIKKIVELLKSEEGYITDTRPMFLAVIGVIVSVLFPKAREIVLHAFEQVELQMVLFTAMNYVIIFSISFITTYFTLLGIKDIKKAK